MRRDERRRGKARAGQSREEKSGAEQRRAELGGGERSWAEEGGAGQKRAGLGREERSGAEQDRAGQNRAVQCSVQCNAERSGAEQSKEEQGRAGQRKAGQSRGGQGRAEQGRAEQSGAEWSGEEQSRCRLKSAFYTSGLECWKGCGVGKERSVARAVAHTGRVRTGGGNKQELSPAILCLSLILLHPPSQQHTRPKNQPIFTPYTQQQGPSRKWPTHCPLPLPAVVAAVLVLLQPAMLPEKGTCPSVVLVLGPVHDCRCLPLPLETDLVLLTPPPSHSPQHVVCQQPRRPQPEWLRPKQPCLHDPSGQRWASRPWRE